MQHLKKTPEELWFRNARSPIKGELYGIEFEMEATNYLPTQDDLRGAKIAFTKKVDNSLRGNSAEFIAAGPLKFEDLKLHCKNFYELLDRLKTKVQKNSPRTSTHVHLNFSDKSVAKIIDFICLFYCVENLMLSLAGPKRIHNQFCYSLRDAEDQLNQLYNLLYWTKNVNNPAAYKYANLNLCNLSATGTLEIRSLEGYPTQEKLQAWLQILHEMYVVSQSPNFNIEDNIIHGISGMTPYYWLRETLPTLCQNILVPRREIEESIYEDFRLIQPFIFKYTQELKKLEMEEREETKKPQKEQEDPNQRMFNEEIIQRQVFFDQPQALWAPRIQPNLNENWNGLAPPQWRIENNHLVPNEAFGRIRHMAQDDNNNF